jgi:hypothetical protein
MPLFDQGMMQGQDPRGLLAKLMMLLRGGPGGPSAGQPPAPGGAPPTDMSMAGPWGAGIPPTPTPTPRPEPSVQPVPVPQQRPTQRLNRGQY